MQKQVQQSSKLSRIPGYEGSEDLYAGAEIVLAARALIGTPFRHQARVPKVGLDCVGLVWYVGNICGYRTTDRKGYGRDPDGSTLVSALNSVAKQIPFPVLGCIVVIECYKDMPYHLGILGDYVHGGFSLIHSEAYVGKVTEHYFNEEDYSVVGYWAWQR